MESLVKKLVKNKMPFAVIQYYEWFKLDSSEKNKQYEFLYINEQNLIISKKIDDVRFFKEFVLNKSNLVKSTPDGNVWEFNQFKERYDKHNFSLSKLINKSCR